MEITHKAKEELDHRIRDIENFIARKGLGSSYLERARKAQRNLNLAVLAGGALLVAGVALWAMTDSEED